MNESTRTLGFLGAAAASVVMAFFFAPSTPTPPSDFSEVGKPFFPDFDVSAAKSLSVVTFSDNASEPKVFRVEQKNNKWGILLDPANGIYYPADGETRLGNTAASVLEVRREQFVTKDPEQYATLRVVDPLETDVTKLLGRGRRVTLKDADDKTLADYIIGDKVPRRPTDGDQVFYYVRRPDEKNVYTAKLNIDLSVKFSDWIESDLLKLQNDNIVEMMAHKYTLAINQQTGGASLKGEETNILTREKSSDPWKLEGLNEEKEEVNQEEVNGMTRALDDLKIIGARPKPEALTAELKANRKLEIDELSWRELASKGFYQTPDERFLSSEGQVEALTDAGVKYTFRFGNSIVASDDELESGLESDKKKAEGSANKTAATNKGRYVFITTEFVEQGLGPKPKKPVKESFLPPAAKPAEAKPTDPAPTEKEPVEKQPEEKKSEEKPADAPKEGDAKPDAAKPAEEKPAVEKPAEEKPAEEKKVEEKPAADADKSDAAVPEKPCGDDTDAAPQESEAKPEAVKPEDAKPAESPAKPDETKPEAPQAADAPKATEPAKATDAPKATEPPAAKEPAQPTEAPKSAEPKGPTPEQQAEANFKQAQVQYEKDLKAYEEKVAAGKKKVQELNARFAQWYYVISDENFQKLRLSRKGLVKDKAKPMTDAATGGKPEGLLPGVKLPNGILPPDLTPDSDTDPASPKPESPKPESPADKGTPDTKPAEEKPADPKPTEEKSATEKPATEKPAEPKAEPEQPATEKPADAKTEEVEKKTDEPKSEGN